MLRFHAVHGANIHLELDAQKATRAPDSFCDGITFSQENIVIGELYAVQVWGRPDDSDWSGALRLGVTTIDPSTLASNLPKYACPDLITKDGFWARPIKEELIKTKAKIGFCLNIYGELQLTINNQLMGCLFTDLPIDVPMWALIDIYGSTQSVQFVIEDNIPAEILARGPGVVDAYLTLRKRGNAPLFRGRLFLLGQDRPSNNRLKATLMGENVASDDFSSSTLVNCNHYCKINAKAKWKSKFEIQTTGNQEKTSLLNLEDDYELAIARNVAIEILKSRQNTKKMAKNKLHKNGKKLRATLQQQLEAKNKSNKVAPTSDNTTLAKLPPNMVTLVESCLKELEMDKANNKGKDNAIIVDLSAEQDLPGDIGLSVWQLNGHPDLMSTFYHFLSHEAIYVLTFDLLQDLNDLAPKTEWDIVNQTWIETDSEMTNLEYLLTWINYIYHQSRIKHEEANNIIIVGTNRSQLHPDFRAQEGQANLKFEVIREALRGQAMEKNVCQTFFALDELDLETDDQDQHFCEGCCQFCQLKLKVYHLSLRLPRMGMRIPESWVQFEKVLHLWLSRGIQFAAVDEMFESYKGGSLESFQSLLGLYEDLGMIYLVEKQDDNHGLVIFDTQSFFTLIAQLSSPFHFAKLKTTILENRSVELNGWLSASTLKKLCSSSDWDVNIINFGMNSLGLLYNESESVCFLPSINLFEIEFTKDPEITNETEVYFEFCQTFPRGAFYLFIVELLKLSSIIAFQMISSHVFTFQIDQFHQIFVENLQEELENMKFFTQKHFIKIWIRRRKASNPQGQLQASPQVCTVILSEIGNALATLCSKMFPRITFQSKVLCICGGEKATCAEHDIINCKETQCLHLINLDEALSSSMIWCGHKQINTISIRKTFSISASELPMLDNYYELHSSNSTHSYLPLSPPDLSTLFHLRPPSTRSRLSHNRPTSPSWLRGASKLLDSGFNHDSWRHLGELLGYKDFKLDQFEGSYQPSKTLLKYWLESCNGSEMGTELLLASLKELRRFDVIDVINDSEEEQKKQLRRDIFISYQWDNQKEVLAVRSKLEKAGFTCWMDIGQIGGGDQLYNEIYKGIFHSQVMLVFISPRLVLSEFCIKEVNLADMLRMPIIPIMIEKTPWPPPGALAMILSQHVYIDLAGTGGHGGCGKDADWSTKLRELIRRLRLYTKEVLKDDTEDYEAVCEVMEAAPVGAGVPEETEGDEEEEEEDVVTQQSWTPVQSTGVPCCVSVFSSSNFCTIL